MRKIDGTSATQRGLGKTVRLCAASGTLAAVVVACGGGAAEMKAPRAPEAAPSSVAVSMPCKRMATAHVKPLTAPRTSSTVALGTMNGKTLAYVADEDGHAVQTIDVDAKTQIATTPLEGAPSHLILTTDGRLLVGVRDRAKVQVLEPTDKADKPLGMGCWVETAAEPLSLAITPDDSMVVVSSGWGRTLAAFDSEHLAKKFEVALGREPRAVVTSDDGKTAFVSHAVGSLISVVDLAHGVYLGKPIKMRGRDQMAAMRLKSQRAQFERMKAAGKMSADVEKRFSDLDKKEEETGRVACQGYALAKSMDPGGRVLAPQVMVEGGDPSKRAEGYGDDDSPTEAADIAVIDEGTATPIDASLAVHRERQFLGGADDPRDHHAPCLLPRAAAVDSASRTLLVSCLGIDDVIAYDAAAASPERAEKRRWDVGAGANGIAVDGEKHRAVVWAQFDRVLNVLSLVGPTVTDEKTTPPAPVARIELSPLVNPLPPEIALGRLLFHAAADVRIAKDGRACASCHPDGRDDGITWSTPEGPRRTILLAGRVGKTPPYSWGGGEKSLREHLATTFDRLDGTGLRSIELDAIVAYVSTLAPPNTLGKHAKDAKYLRGEAIFNSKEAQCSSCHAPQADFSDGQLHDVKSKTDADRKATFNTPSLKGVGGTGPWFHDGRYASIHDLLRSVDGKMGHTKQLSEADLDSLESYLRTL